MTYIAGLIDGLLVLVEFGTIGFWIVLGLVSCFMVGFLEFKRSVWATVTFLFTLYLLHHTLGSSGAWLTDSWLKIALDVFVYIFVVGVIWAIFKWWRKVANLAQECRELKSEFLRKWNISGDTIPKEHWGEWQSRIDYHIPNGLKIDGDSGIIPPHPNDFKEEIYMWIFFWPWSMVWFVIDEPVRKLARWIYEEIRGSLVKISEHAFRDIKGDFTHKPKQFDED